MGIPNLGNTCYLATCLQCLRACPSFRELVRTQAKFDRTMRMLGAFFDVLDKDGRDANVLSSTRELYAALGSNTGDQEDVHECLLGMIERLSSGHRKRTEVLAKTRSKIFQGMRDSLLRQVVTYMDEQWTPKTDLEALVTGQLVHVTVCTECERLRLSADDFTSLSVSSPDIARGIQDYMSVDSISELECDWCKRRTRSNRVTRVHRCPKILLVLAHGTEANKSVPEVIDLKSYTSQMLDDRKTIEYDLRSAACHFGTLKYGGHYVALAKNSDGRWSVYNDTVETDSSDPKVRSMIASKAYLIVYEQR